MFTVFLIFLSVATVFALGSIPFIIRSWLFLDLESTKLVAKAIKNYEALKPKSKATNIIWTEKDGFDD